MCWEAGGRLRSDGCASIRPYFCGVTSDAFPANAGPTEYADGRTGFSGNRRTAVAGIKPASRSIAPPCVYLSSP